MGSSGLIFTNILLVIWMVKLIIGINNLVLVHEGSDTNALAQIKTALNFNFYLCALYE